MDYFADILKSLKDNSLYIGMSSDPEKRLCEHNRGESRYTKGHRPYRLILKEGFGNRASARKREKQLKSGAEREKIRKLIPGSSVGRADGC